MKILFISMCAGVIIANIIGNILIDNVGGWTGWTVSLLWFTNYLITKYIPKENEK
jgi:uncharacterized membrane protein YoaK (UPF0700 family)